MNQGGGSGGTKHGNFFKLCVFVWVWAYALHHTTRDEGKRGGVGMYGGSDIHWGGVVGCWLSTRKGDGLSEYSLFS